MTSLKLRSVVCLLPAKNCKHSKFSRIGAQGPFYNAITSIIFFTFFFPALKLTNRTSAAAFDTKIKIKVAWGQFEEALELVDEWRMIEPDVRKLKR